MRENVQIWSSEKSHSIYLSHARGSPAWNPSLICYVYCVCVCGGVYVGVCSVLQTIEVSNLK